MSRKIAGIEGFTKNQMPEFAQQGAGVGVDAADPETLVRGITRQKTGGSPACGEEPVSPTDATEADARRGQSGRMFLPNWAAVKLVVGATLNEKEGVTDNRQAAAHLSVSVLRSLPELESVRSVWTQWNGHPNSDIDVYRMLMDCRADFLRPHVISVGRQGQPEAMLIGRIVRQSVEFKIGYRTILQPNLRVLNIVHGGMLGNLTGDNSKLLTREILESLRRGEADMAALNFVRVHSPLYAAATGALGWFGRDLFPVVQPHWRMRLPRDAEEVGQGSKDFRELRRKGRKLLADHPNQVRVFCFREVDELERVMRDVEQIAKKTYQRGLGVGFADDDQTRQMLHFGARQGWLRAYVLYVAETPCAYWIGNKYQDVFYGDFVGYDPAYGKYAPGKFLMLKGIEDFCKEGIREIDFGLGDATYKQGFGNSRWEEAKVCFFAPSLKGLWLNSLRIPIGFVDQAARKMLRETATLAQLKKTWRDHVRFSPKQS